MIAMAISCNPDILIADEPTTALDVTIQAQIIDVVREMQAVYDSGVILITHDLGVVAQMADKVMVMYGGRTVEYGPVDEVYYNPHQPYTWGLLGSLPRLDETEKQRLTPIKGQPPNLLLLPPGCPFVGTLPLRTPGVPRPGPNSRSLAPTTGCTAGSRSTSAWRSARTLPQFRTRRRVSLLEVSDLKKHFPIRRASCGAPPARSTPSTASHSRSRRARRSASSARAAAASRRPAGSSCACCRRPPARSSSTAST